MCRGQPPGRLKPDPDDFRDFLRSGAVEALLHYLPYAPDDETREEIWYGLAKIGVVNGKVQPALLAALKDNTPDRRAVADAHLPVAAEEPGCLVVLSERLRESPGVVAIEANFHDNTLTVRYRPALVAPDGLNALADEVGAMFAQRVTTCQQREAQGTCGACDLRLGRLSRPEDIERLIAAVAEF